MKEAFWGYFLIALGMFVIVILLLVQRLTTTNEENFYMTREVLEASMLDAVDYGSYRLSGRIIMSAEKFEEVFIRRFAESITNNKSYTLEFYDIYEEPPKASVRVRTSSGTTTINSDSFGISVDTILSGILETLEGTNGNNVVISGKNKIGEKLSAVFKNTSKSGSISYKWYYTDDNDTERGTEISGATDNTLVLTDNLLNKYIYVVVKSSTNDKIYKDITDSITNGWSSVALKDQVKVDDLANIDFDSHEKVIIDEDCYDSQENIIDNVYCKGLEELVEEQKEMNLKDNDKLIGGSIISE